MTRLESLVANTAIMQLAFDGVGDVTDDHRHTFDHQTLVAAGAVTCTVDGVADPRVFRAPTILRVAKGRRHAFTATEPHTVLYCIHALRQNTGDVHDPEARPGYHESLPLTQETA